MLHPRILYLEDDLLTSKKAIRALAPLGATIDHATNYLDVQVFIAQQKYDIAILDVYLENDTFTGIEVAERLVEETQIPVLFTTSFSDEFTLMRMRALRGTDYLPKPFLNPALLAKVKYMLHARPLLPRPGRQLSDGVYVKSNGAGYRRTEFLQILYLESSKGTTIFRTDGKTLQIGSPLKRVVADINRRELLQINRSNAVWLPRVTELYNEHLIVQKPTKDEAGNTTIESIKLPIGGTFRKLVHASFFKLNNQ